MPEAYNLDYLLECKKLFIGVQEILPWKDTSKWIYHAMKHDYHNGEHIKDRHP